MQVSSYLEAFLTVYGWDMYYVLYLLFAVTGIFLYPFLRILNDVYINYVSGNEYAGTNYLRQLIASIAMAGLVFFVALVPVVSISLSSTVVKSSCAEKKNVLNFKPADYFNNTDTRVPLMPYLAMGIGHGINSVIYNEKTCTVDVTEVAKGVMAVDLSEAENPEVLGAEVNRFVAECHSKARNLLKSVLNDKYGEAASIEMKSIMKTEVDALVASTHNYDRKNHEQYLLNNYDSPLIKKLFYKTPSPLSSITELKVSVPLEASNPVEGINGYQANGSAQQGSATPPSCDQWWEGSGDGLKYRMVDAMEKKLAINIAHELGVPHCQNDYPFIMTDRRKGLCVDKIKQDLYSGSADELTAEMFRSIQGKGETDSVLTDAEAGKLGGLATAGIASSVLSVVTGRDLSLGLISQATSMYMTIFLLKLMLKYFVPMILMTIYMFWGMYMVIGEFSGMKMIRGMILIIAVVIMPSLWSIVDHLDDSLYQSMYSNKAADDMLKFNMLLLDITTGMFQIAIVFVVFYLINEAGGGNAGGAVRNTQEMGNKGAGGFGGSIGGGVGKIGGAANGGIKSAGKAIGGGYSKFKQRMKPYKVTQPGTGGKK